MIPVAMTGNRDIGLMCALALDVAYKATWVYKIL